MSFYALRKRNGFTQARLAHCLNVERSTVSKWETGATYPRGLMLLKLAKVFNCTTDEVLSSLQNSTEGR